MSIYANGEGVRRDLDLAIHFACALQVGPEEMHARVLRLDRLRAERWTGHDFDFVLDDRSTFSGSAGPDYFLRVDRERRAAELRSLTNGWNGARRAALARVQRAMSVYAEAHATAAFAHASPAAGVLIEPIDHVEAAFIGQVRALAGGHIPHYSPAEVEATRRRIAHNFRMSQRLLSTTADVMPSDFARAERAWRAYRDSFIAHARLTDPDLAPDRLATWLGRTRPDRWSLNTSFDEGDHAYALPFDIDY